MGAQAIATSSTTAIGFDERMLLHAEVWFWIFIFACSVVYLNLFIRYGTGKKELFHNNMVEDAKMTNKKNIY